MEKKFIYVFIGLIVAVGLIVLVSAATTFISPVTGGNYSTTMLVNVTTALNDVLNVTIYYNSSGGAAGTDASVLDTIVNTSNSQTTFTNASVSLVGMTETSTYNISAYADNGTDQEWAAAASTVTIDDTPPSVTSFQGVIDGGIYNGVQDFNVSVVDALIGLDSAYFNLTNSSGVQKGFLKYTYIGGVYNYSGNITVFSDLYGEGLYNLTVYVNDSLNNVNNTETITIRFDNTIPVILLSQTSVAESSMTITATITDVGGINSSCTSSRARSTVAGTGTTQTITEDTLSCSSSYQYNITCTDSAGNVNSTGLVSFSTSGCPTASTSSGGYNNNFWTFTYVPSETELQEKYSKSLGEGKRIRFKVQDQTHHMGVIEVGESMATINISSDPIQLKLDVGEDAKVDVNLDDYYDIYVLLNSIENNNANLTIQSINEMVPEGESSVETSGEVTSSSEDNGESNEGVSNVGATIGIVVIVILIIAAAVALSKRKQ